jgi:hypothetical protein
MGWAVNATPRPLYRRENQPAYCLGGLVGPRVGLDGCEKSRPHTGIRSPGPPDTSKSLYRLSYPGPITHLRTNEKFSNIQGNYLQK